jgi:hypothetical protein
MACYQSCTVEGVAPDECRQQCCTGSQCDQWTTCVAAQCSAACF